MQNNEEVCMKRRLKQNVDMRKIINYCHCQNYTFTIYHWRNKAGVWMWRVAIDRYPQREIEVINENLTEAIKRAAGKIYG